MSLLFCLLFQVLDAPKSRGDLLGFHRNLTPTQLPWLNEVTTKLFDTSRMTIDAGTVTPKPTTIQLDDVFLAVKTTQTNQAKRLNIIAKTWFQMAREQVILVRFHFPQKNLLAVSILVSFLCLSRLQRKKN